MEALLELIAVPKNTTQCPGPGCEPGPLDPEVGALTMRPPRLDVAKGNPVNKSYTTLHEVDRVILIWASKNSNTENWALSFRAVKLF